MLVVIDQLDRRDVWVSSDVLLVSELQDADSLGKKRGESRSS